MGPSTGLCAGKHGFPCHGGIGPDCQRATAFEHFVVAGPVPGFCRPGMSVCTSRAAVRLEPRCEPLGPLARQSRPGVGLQTKFRTEPGVLPRPRRTSLSGAAAATSLPRRSPHSSGFVWFTRNLASKPEAPDARGDRISKLLPVRSAMDLTIASPSPLPLPSDLARSNRCVRRARSSADTTGPSLATTSVPSAARETSTGRSARPCRKAFSIRLRSRIAKASGSGDAR